MSSNTILLIFCGLALANSGLSGIPDSANGESLTIVQGFAFADVSINGREPFRMLIDSGAEACSLSPEAATRAGLLYDHRTILTSISGEKTVPLSSHNRVRVGSAEASDLEIVVNEPKAVRKLRIAADGVIGNNFLKQFPYLLDYRRKKLWFNGEAASRSNALPIAAAASDVKSRTVLAVGFGADARTWRLALDSGASDLMLQCGTLCPRMIDAKKGAILTNLGVIPAQYGTLWRLEIGGRRVVGGRAAMVSSPALDPFDGVLPARWFSAVYVDSAHQLARFSAGPSRQAIRE